MSGAAAGLKLVIRAARPDDAPALARIQNRVIRDTLFTFTTTERGTDSFVADIGARGAAFQVADLGGETVGFATFYPFRSGPGYVHTAEHSVHLAPTAQGRGIGQALMVRLEQVAREQGIRVLVAGISGANPGSVSFHERLGFVTVGRMPGVGRKAGQWLDLVLMQKTLGDDLPPDSAGASG